MTIYDVKINGYKNPLGYDPSVPTLSWKVKDCRKDSTKQKWVKIQISDLADFSHIAWEKEGDLSSLSTPLDLDMKPYTRYFVRIEVESDSGERGVSSDAFFEAAKLSEPWEASWIGVDEGDTHPEFIKRFSSRGEIKNARLYITGLGMFEAYINGERVGNDVLAPFINDYKEHYQYCTYDVTDMIREENEISVLLGDGWYRGRFGLSHATHFELPYALIAELRIEYKNGTVQTILSDDTWKYRKSFVSFSNIYDGEVQNYLVDNSYEKSAKLLTLDYKLAARYSLPLHYMEKLDVKEVIKTPKGELVLDFGQNLSGHVAFDCHLPLGCEIRLDFGEILQDGCFYNDNYRSAESKFVYISDGKRRTVRPKFTFFGFRYVRVSGVSDIDKQDFSAYAIYSEMDEIGKIRTGNKKINQLFSNSLWGLKSNFLDMPTDCPQRDERLGWCGDAQVFSTTAGFHMDTRAFYHKFLRDLRSDQKRLGGAVAIYLPNEFPGLSCGVWSDIAAFLPKMLYDYYGDISVLREHFPLMKDWVDYVHRKDCERGQKDLYDFGFQFGDWLALDGATEQSSFGRTDNGFVCSAYYYASATYVAEAAGLLGFDDLKKEYSALAERVKGAILSEYFTTTGRLAIDTQTAYLVALKFGIFKDKERLISGLTERFKKDLYKIKGGFVGATMMNCVLAENGLSDMAYDLLFYEGFPGWLYAINLGATTIWERWNSVLPDGKISGTGMNSLNHYAYGSVVEFLYRYSAGITPLSPGFKRVKIAPIPHARLGSLQCSYDSASGRYVSDWSINKDGTLSFHIEVPFDCEAEICMPEKEPFTVPAGIYDYVITTKKNYLTLYSEFTSFDRLFGDEEVVEILKKHVPDIYYSTDRGDEEAMSKSLADSKISAMLFHKDTAGIDLAISEIKKIEVK